LTTNTIHIINLKEKGTSILFVILYLLVMSNQLAGQSADISKKDSLEWENKILPVAFYLPETSFAFGATGILTFKNSSQTKEERPSQILFAGIYTLKNQIEFLSTFELYADHRKHRRNKCIHRY